MDKEQQHKDLTEQVIDIIFNALNLKHIKRESVNLETPLTKGGLDLDSVDILELIVNFEQVFGIKLNESEAYAQYFKNIGTVVDFVMTQKNGAH
jgi:acyl carrier protein